MEILVEMIEMLPLKLSTLQEVRNLSFCCQQEPKDLDELLQMVRFGAEMVFSLKDSTIIDEDMDRIIAKGEEATAELDAKMKNLLKMLSNSKWMIVLTCTFFYDDKVYHVFMANYCVFIYLSSTFF